ncbi:MAG: hypothetical protein HDR01_14350 [Lachnospiraceae bacterium]|nr:hypothetical protein [Lachnospiraceae bacterium]
MDFGGISTYFGNQLAENAQSKTESKISSLDSSDFREATDEELMDVCKEFEAYFMEQIFKEMKKTVPQSDYSSNATASMMDYMEDSLLQEYAAQATETNSLGLAQVLYEQMKRNYGA